MAKTTLVLFDIDGTLLTTGGVGQRALRSAFLERFQIDEDFRSIEIAGRTDSGIARELFAAHKLELTPVSGASFLETYLDHLARELPASPGQLLPGVAELLTRLKSNPDVLLALLTGNLARGAELKLRHYGIWHFFEFGAFADDHHDRNELGRCALHRASETHGSAFPPDRTYVIGDTPHDVACGKACGARTIAVATGRFNLAELARSEPDVLFEDLSDVNAVLQALSLSRSADRHS